VADTEALKTVLDPLGLTVSSGEDTKPQLHLAGSNAGKIKTRD
jgi:hypothetical protein